MGIMDSRLELVESTDDVTNEAGTTSVGDIIDLEVAGRDVGNGQPVYLNILVITAADGGATTNGTISFALATDSTTTVAVDGTQTVHWESDTFASATELTAGTRIVAAIPTGTRAFERYMQLQMTYAVEGEDDLAIQAWLSFDPTGWKAYADGTN